MKKNELIHLHALLVRVARDYVARGDASPEAFEPYHELDVTPMSLREPRASHEAAVRTLAGILADLSTTEDEAVVPVGASGTTADAARAPATAVEGETTPENATPRTR
jgi:hypothetical protein